MKITVKSKNLKNVIGAAQVCAAKNSVSVENTKVHLATRNGELVAYGSNGSCAVTIIVEGACVEGEGVCSIDASLVSNVLSSIGEDKDVILNMEGDKTIVTSDTLRLELPVFDSKIVPDTAPKDKGMPLDVGMMAAVEHCCAADETQPVAEAVCVKHGGSGISMVSCDSHRMSIRGEYDAADAEILIPHDSVRKISRIFADSTNVKFYGTATKLFVFDEKMVFTSSLTNGVYFNITKMLEVERDTMLTIPRKEWIAGLKPYISISEGAVVLTADEDEVKLSVMSSSKKTALSNIFKTEKSTVKQALKVGLNPVFLAQALESVDDESVTIRFNSTCNTAPVYLEGDGYKEIFMPISLAK